MPYFGGKTTRFIILGLIVLGAGSFWGASKFAQKTHSICEVQGISEISRFVGKEVTIIGIVWAQLDQGNPAGFFLVDQNCSVDGGSSQGIFVQVDNFENIVHLGDELRVKGLIEETGGETRIISDQSEIEILTLGNDLPPVINLAEEFLQYPECFQYENWEGMLVSFPEGEILTGYLDSDLPRLLPIFDLDPSLQMVCLYNQSITLQLLSSEKIEVLENVSTGYLVQNLAGILRQNTSGYLLDLIKGYDFAEREREPIQNRMDSSTFAGLQITETQDIITSGTPTITTGDISTYTLIPSATIIPSVTYYPVHLLISEFYPNPIGKEPDGEWVEIYNPKPYAQPLTGIKLGDETSPDGNEGMLRFPDGYYIENQEVLIVARQAKGFYLEFGFLPDFEMEDSDDRIPDLLSYSGWGRSGIQFSNNGDEVLLLDPWDGIIDMLVYGNSTAGEFSEPPAAPKEGNSLERYPPESDRDRGEDWREREGGSPGRLDRSPPTLVFSPTQEPSVTWTPSPQVPPSGTVSITPIRSATMELTDSLTPSVEAVPSLSPIPLLTSTIPVTSEQSLTPTLTLTPSPSLTEMVETTITPSISISPSFTVTSQITVYPPASETPDPEETVTGTAAILDTPLASMTPSLIPGITATIFYVEDLEILLNEIHADPDLAFGDANNDGAVHSDDDEFLEFVNIAENDLDLSGWFISDSLRTRYTFPDGTILKERCAVVVFGGGDPQGDFGGSLIFSAGSLGLNNTGDAISLYDESGEQRLFYLYGSEGGENQSLTRSPDIMGTLPLILHGEVDGSNGGLYSPGVMLDGVNFGDCP